MSGAGQMPGDGRAAPAALRVANLIDQGIGLVASTIGVLSIVAIFLALMADVIVRYLTTRGLGWPAEVPNLLFPWLVMGGIVLAAHRGAHISVSLLLDAISLGAARVLLVAMQVLILVTFAYLAFVAIDVIKVTGHQLFPLTGIPQFYAYAAMIFGFVGIVATCAVHLVRVLYAEDPRVIFAEEPEHTL
jgi:TRAP-type C4-dicarboxylate transport system permease small subunit